jgi:putative mycofactocin binding protein MftB
MTAEFEPARSYRLNRAVALRPEPFGALACHFGTRRLSFLKAPDLVDLVRGLGTHRRASDALATVPESRRDVYLRALAALATALRAEASGGACPSCSAFDSCQGGCMAAKFFTGLPLDGPDPECVKGHGASALSAMGPGGLPQSGKDHSHRGQAVALGMPSMRVPAKPCDSSPLAVTG